MEYHVRSEGQDDGSKIVTVWQGRNLKESNPKKILWQGTLPQGAPLSDIRPIIEEEMPELFVAHAGPVDIASLRNTDAPPAQTADPRLADEQAAIAQASQVTEALPHYERIPAPTPIEPAPED